MAREKNLDGNKVKNEDFFVFPGFLKKEVSQIYLTKTDFHSLSEIKVEK